MLRNVPKENAMRLSKAQAAVITVLNVIIATLVAVIFLVPYFSANGETGGGGGGANGDDPGTQDPPVTAPPHEKLRNATDGKTPEILRETRLMGSGDETVVAAYFKDGVSFIFGNATVGDLDFDAYGGFLCMVNAGGTIIKYTYFDGSITAVGIVGGGYAVSSTSRAGTDEARHRLYYVDYTGQAVSTGETTGPVVDIFSIDGSKAGIVTQPSSTALVFFEYSVATLEWTVGKSTRINSSYTLKYFDCYDFGGSYVISARCYMQPRYDAVVFYSFAAGSDAEQHLYGGGSESMTHPYAVMPFGGGYFALAAKDGLATVISVDYTFTSYHSSSLGFTFTDARLLYCGGKYYACFDRADGAETYELTGELRRSRLPSLDGTLAGAAVSVGSTVIAGRTATAVNGSGKEYGEAKIVAADTGAALALKIKNAAFCGGFKNSDGITLVLTATGGAALSEPSGGSDVYIITVRDLYTQP